MNAIIKEILETTRIIDNVLRRLGFIVIWLIGVRANYIQSPYLFNLLLLTITVIAIIYNTIVEEVTE